MSKSLWVVLYLEPTKTEAKSFLKGFNDGGVNVKWFGELSEDYVKNVTDLTIFIPPILDQNSFQQAETRLHELFGANELSSLEFSWVDTLGNAYTKGISLTGPEDFCLLSAKLALLKFRKITLTHYPILMEKKKLSLFMGEMDTSIILGKSPNTQMLPLSSETKEVVISGEDTKILGLMTCSHRSALESIQINESYELECIDIHGLGKTPIQERIKESQILLKASSSSTLLLSSWIETGSVGSIGLEGSAVLSASSLNTSILPSDIGVLKIQLPNFSISYSQPSSREGCCRCCCY